MQSSGHGEPVEPCIFGRLLSVIVLFVILTAGWWIRPEQVEGIPLCWFKWFSGFDCPGCGLTRSFLSIPRGEWLAAFRYNAAGPLVYFFFLYYFVERIGNIFGKKRLIRVPTGVSKIFGGVVVVLLFGHWVIRLF